MKPDKFIDSIGHIDDGIIEEYEKTKKLHPPVQWIRYVSIAASVIVVLAVSTIIWMHGGSGNIAVVPNITKNTAEVPSTVHDSPEPSGEFKILSVYADKKTGNYISGDTAFLICTENGTEEEVQSHLYISSDPEYHVRKIAEETFEVRLTDKISDNTVVSLSYVENGIIDYSWAFQTEGKLSLSQSYPRDGAETVPTESVIELEFSYSSAEGIESAVSFYPSIDGSWEHCGRIWRFIPAAPLEKNSTYTINIGNGITAEGKALEKTSQITFSTYEERAPYRCSADIITEDGINSYLPGEDITLRYIDYSEENAVVGKIEIDIFDSYTDMIAYSEGEIVYNASPFGEVGFIPESGGKNAVNMTLTDSLPQGYYAAHVYSDDGIHLFDWIIQIHPLSLYVAASERDILVWAALDGELAEGVSVSFGDIIRTTDNDGIALFEDVPDGGGDVRYLLAGSSEFPMVVGTPSFSRSNYPASYIYTDKLKYKCRDTVRVWGMIPLDLFYDEIDGDFEVMIDEERDTAVKVTPDENGVFTCEIPLNNHTDGYFYVHIMYKNSVLGYRYISIMDYSLNNYECEIVSNKLFLRDGETLELDVKINHISGIKAVGKKLCASVNEQNLYAETDANGTAHFTIGPEIYQDPNFYKPGEVSNLFISIYSGDSDISWETRYGDFTAKFVTTPYLVTTEYSKDMGKLEIRFNTADTDAANESGSIEDLYGEPYDTSVTSYVYLRKTYREITEYEYDPFGKIKSISYSEERSEYTVLAEKISETENGIIAFDTSGFSLPDATETERYSITCTIIVETDGIRSYNLNDTLESNYYESSYNPSNGFSNIGPIAGETWERADNYYLYAYKYNVSNPEYEISMGERYMFSPGDTVKIELSSYYNTMPEEGDRLLRFMYVQSIQSIDILDGDKDPSFIAGEEIVPYINLSGAYFHNGKFYRIQPEKIYTDSKSRTLDISITPDSDSYSPGDKVTLDIEALDYSGAPVSASVGISVVNEAVFSIYDYTNITPTILRGAYSKIYTFSSYRDYSLYTSRGGWGGGGGRIDNPFIDTAYFGTVKTDENGHCTVEFTLPEDAVTSYRITVHAANRNLYSGVGTANIEASSDFFVQPGEIKGAKSADDLAVSGTLISDIMGTAEMTFTVNELNLKLTVTAVTGTPAYANFGKLPVGDYTVTISAVSAEGDRAHEITIPISIAESVLHITEEHTEDLNDSLEIIPSSSPVKLKIFNKETKRYLDFISYIKDTYSKRFDTIVGCAVAAEMEQKINGDATGIKAIDNYVYNYIVKDDVHMDSSLIAQLPDAEGDPILTALSHYISDITVFNTNSILYMSRMPYAATEEQAARSLLLKAAAGEPVLADLLYAKDHVSDDPYVRTILSLAFSFTGDTGSAAKVLLPVTDRSRDGAGALYAAALVYIDREAAAKEIYNLYESNPSELYLDLAAALYMRTGVSATGSSEYASVLYGEQKITVEAGILEVKSLVLSVSEGDIVRFTDVTENVCISYSYQSSFTPKEDERNVRGLTAELPSELSLYQSCFLQIDLSSVIPAEDESDGEIKIALPNCFRYDPREIMQSNLYIIPMGNTLIIRTTGKADKIINIPMIAASPGNYILEPIIFTSNGIHYYSDKIDMTVK